MPKLVQLVCLLLIVLIFPPIILAKAPPPPPAPTPPPIPEISGDYPDPQFPWTRVRVFVNEFKTAGGNQSVLTCTDPDSN